MFDRDSFVPPTGADALSAAIDELAGVNLEGIADVTLTDELLFLSQAKARLSAQILRRLGEFDVRNLSRADGLATSTWWQNNTHCNPGIARRDLLLARRLRHDRPTADALADGTITAAHAAVIHQALAALPRELQAEHRTVIHEALLAKAKEDHPQALKGFADEIRAHCDPDGADVDAKHAHESRWLDVSSTYRRMVVLRGMLDPEAGALLLTALEPLIRPAGPDDTRSAPTRRADALTELARRALDSGDLPDCGGVKPHVSILIKAEDLAASRGSGKMPNLSDVTLTTRCVRRWLCDASVTRILLAPNGQPLDVGRETRTVSAALRKALVARDKGCAFPGCHAPPGWCDAHHRRHWADGGETCLGNLVLLCRRHHTYVHQIGNPDTLPPPETDLPLMGKGRPAEEPSAPRPPPQVSFV